MNIDDGLIVQIKIILNSRKSFAELYTQFL